MASAISAQSRTFFVATLATISLLWFDTMRAQEAPPLPDYVIEQFGEPPLAPEGPLSEALQSAVQVAFIDSMVNSIWGQDQALALNKISESKDPRLVWIISDLMRFVSGRVLN